MKTSGSRPHENAVTREHRISWRKVPQTPPRAPPRLRRRRGGAASSGHFRFHPTPSLTGALPQANVMAGQPALGLDIRRAHAAAIGERTNHIGLLALQRLDRHRSEDQFMQVEMWQLGVDNAPALGVQPEPGGLRVPGHDGPL